MYPSEEILIARGKYSTLGSVRRDLLKQIRSACSMLVTEASQIMQDAEKEPPLNPDHLSNAMEALELAGNARAELILVCKEMGELRDLAWGTMDYDDKAPSRKEPAE